MTEIFLPSLELTKRIIGIQRESIGQELINLVSNLGHSAITLRKKEVRIGENENFSKAILRMLPYRIPLGEGQSLNVYSKLYQEFYEHVDQTVYERQIWGRLVTDNKGILITDIHSL